MLSCSSFEFESVRMMLMDEIEMIRAMLQCTFQEAKTITIIIKPKRRQ